LCSMILAGSLVGWNVSLLARVTKLPDLAAWLLARSRASCMWYAFGLFLLMSLVIPPCAVLNPCRLLTTTAGTTLSSASLLLSAKLK